MTTPEAARLQQIRECAPLLARVVPLWMVETIKDLIADELARLSKRRTVVFMPKDRTPGAETWAIHYADQPERIFRNSQTGLLAAWLAIRDADQTGTVRSNDLAAPGAKRPDNIVRDAIRETTLPWLGKHAECPELVAAVATIKVERGQVLFVPRVSDPIFDTGA